MTIGYIYQYRDGSFQWVQIKAALNIYLKEAMEAINHPGIVCRWRVKRK